MLAPATWLSAMKAEAALLGKRTGLLAVALLLITITAGLRVPYVRTRHRASGRGVR